MADYASVEEIQAFARESDGLASETAWGILATAASRAFDALVGVAPDFFAQAGEEPTEKVLFGTGTAYLKLPPYVAGSLDLEGATMGEPGETEALPEWTSEMGEVGVQYLVDRSSTEQTDAYDPDLGRNRCVGFPESIPVNLEANWGWSATPADVKMATISIALYMWRQSDPSFAGISNSDTNLILRNLPPNVEPVVMRYREKFKSTGVFA
jgi:hypothetical protein